MVGRTNPVEDLIYRCTLDSRSELSSMMRQSEYVCMKILITVDGLAPAFPIGIATYEYAQRAELELENRCSVIAVTFIERSYYLAVGGRDASPANPANIAGLTSSQGVETEADLVLQTSEASNARP
jgi:hypothetical protein